MRLIDADALKEYIDNEEFCNICHDRCDYDCILIHIRSEQWKMIIDAQPTVDISEKDTL